MGPEHGQTPVTLAQLKDQARAQARAALTDWLTQMWEGWSTVWPELGLVLADMVALQTPDRAVVEECIATAALWQDETKAAVMVLSGTTANVCLNDLACLTRTYADTEHVGLAYVVEAIARGFGHRPEFTDLTSRVACTMTGEDTVAILGIAASCMRQIGFTRQSIVDIGLNAEAKLP